jgi:uncharacterized protein with von Willebrand factor type A (vWA) domain
VLRGAVVLFLLALSLAACGGTSAAHQPQQAQQQMCPNQQRALVKLTRDITALRTAARLPTKNTLDGNKAINAATDRFLYDVAVAPLTNLQRNRLIDHAMAALIGNCEQCFQALEAGRPIPAIRSGDLKCSK